MNVRVAVVTGAASGIGRASALALARAGHSVVVGDVDEAGGEETVSLIRDDGGVGIFQRVDVSSESDVEAYMDRAISEFGRLDVAHNNAGVRGGLAPTADHSRDDWDRTIAVNLTGTWLCMRAEIHRMLETGGGSIVNTASTFGLVGVPGLPSYVATKHGIVGLTRAAALEYAQQGVRVNAVCPGVTDTPLLDALLHDISGGHPEVAAEQFVAGEPVGRMAKPEEIAQAVAWLASDAASYVTGLAMPVDGGWTAQ